jgi:Mg/Co/Ni transporter MgtE
MLNISHLDVKNHPVPWNSVEPLTGSLEKIHLKVPCPRVSDLHPADVADLFDELSLRERNTVLKSMNTDIIGKVLLECDSDIRQSILKMMTLRKIISILDKMSASDAAYILAEYSTDEISLMLKKLNVQSAAKIEEMLSYKPGSVARYMEHLFVSVPQTMTVEEIMRYIRSLQKYPDNFNYVYVVDENEVLFGVISLKNIILADPSAVVKDIMITKLVTVDMSHPISYVKELITKHDLLSLPVIDIGGRIKGVIDIVEILDIILEETKDNEPLELTDEQKETVDKNKRLKKYYTNIVRDVGKFMVDLDSIKPKKKDYVEHMTLKHLTTDAKKKKDVKDKENNKKK